MAAIIIAISLTMKLSKCVSFSGEVVHPLLSFDPVRVEAVEDKSGVKMAACYLADFEHGKGAICR